MTTRPYSDCLAQALALCGVPDANTVEVARVKTFINRRARQAYAESEIWPRWLVVGEERIVSESGLLPYSQDVLQDIGTVLRIHESQPFVSDPAGEYVDWSANSDGVQISGYTPSAYGGYADMVVSGSISPNINGTYVFTGLYTGSDGVTTTPMYQHPDFSSYQILGGIFFILNGTFLGYRWSVGNNASSTYWMSSHSTDYTTPDLVESSDYAAQGGALGSITVTAVTTYSAFITYKAALPTTYGTGDGETADVPEEWFEWMATGAAASFLFSDKETEAALVLEAQAREDLDAQLAKVSRQNGNKVQTRVLTHGNMQTR